jgi:hypothetical protein
MANKDTFSFIHHKIVEIVCSREVCFLKVNLTPTLVLKTPN